MLAARSKDVETFGLACEDNCIFLDQCLRNIVFSLADDYHQQKQGIARGNLTAPLLAILFSDRLEQQALTNATKTPVCHVYR